MRTAHRAAVILGLGIGLIPGAAAASCAEFPPLEEHLDRAQVVFVGTVTGITDERRTALVEVEEIWRGPDMAAQVTVHGGFADLGFTTADRYFDAGVRYLFAASVNDGRLEDDSCTATRPWSDDLAALRPMSVATPEPVESGPGDGIPAPAVGIALAVLALGGVSILAFRSRT